MNFNNKYYTRADDVIEQHNVDNAPEANFNDQDDD
jgi:hypothetical protein